MDLQAFFEENPKVAVAFSGGVDSSFLLYAAQKYAKSVKAYYVKTAFQPQFELEDAIKLAGELKAELRIIEADILKADEVTANPANRCYFCKRRIFSHILAAAAEDGFETLLDGTNASDDAGDRPGMKALEEMKVLSPLRSCGLTKDLIRSLSKEAGLFTWNKPAYACLATRIPTGCRITGEEVARTEAAEDFMFGLGFENFRVRTFNNAARIQITEAQVDLFMKSKEAILNELRKYYSAVLLDLEYRK